MIQRVRGTDDFLDLTDQTFLLNKFREHCTLYNFSEIQTPIIEPTELFTRSLGTHTDVVHKEMYTFQTASGEEICLRPEVTASTMRAFLQNKITRTPWRVFSAGPMFRHERPQKGRWREFMQINLEVIGSKAIEQDAHFLYMIDRFFTHILKLEDYVLKLNFLGCSNDRKKHRETLITFLDGITEKLCKTCIERKETNLLRIFDCKDESCKKIYQNAPVLSNHLCESCKDEWQQLQTSLSVISVTYVHDPYLVRGLDYYSGTVFEVYDTTSSLGALAGGGRYDSLTKVFGRDDIGATGVAGGVERMILTMEEQKIIQKKPENKITILYVNDDMIKPAMNIASKLRQSNIPTEIDLVGRQFKKQMESSINSNYVLIVGPKEFSENSVVLKNMKSGNENIITIEKLFSDP